MKTALLVLAIVILPALSATAQDLGMFADDDSKFVTVFDSDTGQIRGTIALPVVGGEVGDCAVTPDQTLGFVTDGLSRVHVIDVTKNPPVLAGGINPIPIGNPGGDMEITPDGKFLVVCGGLSAGAAIPISIIDIATRAVVNNFQGSNLDYNALDIDENCHLLTYSSNLGSPVLSVFYLDHNAQMWFVDDYNTTPVYNNACFAPGGHAFVAMDYLNNIIDSYTAPNINYVDGRILSGAVGDNAVSCAFRPQGDAVFARQIGAPGVIDAFAFNPATGQLGDDPLFTIPNLGIQFAFEGVDTIAVDRSGKALYVPQPSGVEIFDADPLGTGELLGAIPIPLEDPTGIAFSRWPQLSTPMAELGIINLTAIDVFAGGATNDRVTGKGTMELAPGADPFDPSTDNVYVELNDLHFVIPAGSFGEHETFGITWWGYTGAVYNDVFNGTVNMQISFEYSTNWQIRTLGLDTSSAVDNPAVLKVRIGDNTGEFPFAWEQQIHHGAGDYSRYTL